MRSLNKRILHIIRHAESELNVVSAHANAGYFEGVTSLDAKLSSNGVNQAKELGVRIQNEDVNDPYLLRQADLVVTSPLSRSILTALHSMPVENYQYSVRHEIAEQVENTTDIGYHKSDLAKMYPQLSDEFDKLPDIWWWQHPSRKDNNNNNSNNNKSTINGMSIPKNGATKENNDDICPHSDASLLIDFAGKSPASESKYRVRERCFEFIEWLYSPLISDYNNIVSFSHACTIRELELLLLSVNNNITDVEASNWADDDSIRNNTEQITFDLPKHSNEIDWDLLKTRVMQAKHIPNHADLE